MPAVHLLDTSVWIRALRRSGHPAIQAHVRSLLMAGTVATCGQVVLEVLGGAATEVEYTRLEADLAGMHHLDITSSDWVAASHLAFTLRRAGLTMPFADVLLAAVAVRHDAIPVHVDEHFEYIATHTQGALHVHSLLPLVR